MDLYIVLRKDRRFTPYEQWELVSIEPSERDAHDVLSHDANKADYGHAVVKVPSQVLARLLPCTVDKQDTVSVTPLLNAIHTQLG